MKILRTLGILAIVAGLMIGGTGSVYAKGPPEGLPAGGPHSPGKHGLFGTVESTDGYDVILVTKDGSTVEVTLPLTAKYKVPRETKGPVDRDSFETILDGAVDGDITAIVGKRVAVLVKDLAEYGTPPPEFTATAIRLMLIPIGPPLHAHRVGIVQEGFISGEGGSITIIDNHGVSHIFGINGETVYRPDGTDDTNIELGSFVTVVTTGDPKNADNDVAKAIVLHEELPDWAGGKIIVQKQTDPDGATDTFEFDSDAFTGGPFSLGDGGQNTSDWLLPGTYYVTETVLPTDWDLTSILPDDDNSTVDLLTATATIHLEAGETVTVVFTDTYTAPAP